MPTRDYLAVDLGAESGRIMLGRFDGQRLHLEEKHRFANRVVRVPLGTATSPHRRISLQWDILYLWSEILSGINAAAADPDVQLAGIGIDTWGVDFGLLDRAGNLLANPFSYRDTRTDGLPDKAFERMPRQDIYNITGIQFLQLNSLYQLLALVLEESPVLSLAETFLTTPDLFNYWLTGQIASEFTIASTTQCLDAQQRTWSKPLLNAMGIPPHIFPDVVMPGTVLGPVRPDLLDHAVEGLAVIASACHDTGSAVVAVPATGTHTAWISSGTWSIVGANTPEPVITPDSLHNNFTNEGGAGGTYRFCRNIMGLWIVQECRRTWMKQGSTYSYADLTTLAASAPPFQSLIDPDHPVFFAPGNMPERVQTYCQQTGQPVPQTPAALVRCALESLALKYRWVLERLEDMVGRRLEPVHIVGGGTQNRLLSQFAANATGHTVITGPVEATATGNMLVQATARGDIGPAADANAVVHASFEIETFEPQERSAWDDAYARLLALMEAPPDA
jgi:rhamnulokinase